MFENDWQQAAQSLGFKTTTELLKDLYSDNRMSLSEIAELLGFSRGAVRRKIHESGVPVRRPGGPNRAGMSRVALVPDEDLKDIKAASIKYTLHPSALFKERRRRKKLNADGNDNGRIDGQIPGQELPMRSD